MRKLLPIVMACTLMAASLAGCSSAPKETAAPETTAAETAAPETTAAETAAEETSKAEESTEAAEKTDAALIRIGSLKGPTSMGLVSLMDQMEQGEAKGNYEFTMVTAADELLAKMVSKELDIALVPANVASVLYNKTEGGVSVININTLGVLDIVSADTSIESIADLKGKTIYMTGKGTTPDYVINYLLTANGLTSADVALEYKSEAAEVAAVLAGQPDAIGLLPQPFVTAACAQNESLSIVLDLTEEWDKVQGEGGSRLVTGVTIVNNDFLADNQEAVDTFLEEHQASAAFTAEDPAKTAELIAAAGIIEKAPLAQKALPYCNITCLTGDEMKAALSGYLNVLFEQDPKSVGGKLPADDFYYLP